MFTIGSLGFTTPLLLLGLATLPILWFLLRAVPPAPIKRLFPGVILLLGLEDDENETDKTPWWLLLLRCLAVAGVIIGFAGPVLNPKAEVDGSGPLLVLFDGTWADARDWDARVGRVEDVLTDAQRSDRPVALVSLTDIPAGELPFQSADAWLQRLPSLTPAPWAPTDEAVAAFGDTLTGGFDTFWMSDGLAYAWRDGLLTALEGQGNVAVFEGARPVYAMRPARFEEGLIQLSASRAVAGGATELTVAAEGLDPNGLPSTLARAPIRFAAGEVEAELELSLPPELRNRLTRFELEGVQSAGAVTLTDDSLKRREVALISGADGREGLELLSPTHYLEQALIPTADLIDGTMSDILLANPDVIVFADIASVPEVEADALLNWVSEGGLLVRFAGPKVAASSVSRSDEDPLMPVRLRAGGRAVGGAMSWGEPKTLRPFSETSPFFGLPVPEEVQVSAQVLAQPDPSLAERTIASLTDGTPLVTRKREGAGQIILFHVTANAEWSTLPLSGMFVQMLERLAISTRPAQPALDELQGTTWVPEAVISAFGQVSDAGTLPGVAGEALADPVLGPGLRPGLYRGEDRLLALNAVTGQTVVAPTAWPARIPVEGLAVERETPLKGMFLAAAIGLLLIDIIASLWISGRLFGPRGVPGTVAALAVAIGMAGLPTDLRAQDSNDDAFALAATAEVSLGYVMTSDSALDRQVEAGLRGLSNILNRRTSVEPAAPTAVNLETDELAFFSFLYWAITPDQPLPSIEAYAKLNRYLRTGGLILFDTRDADVAAFGASSPNGRKLQQLARGLEVPPLEPIPSDHVLTRTFYLLQDFPGRHVSRDVWVEAAPPDAEVVEGMPFRNLNDNVTPIIIGGNDWTAAWATDERGNPLYPVGRGFAGERQREIAYRFGVNLIMHVLTGNYKSDQVHVPALLDRLGQ